MPLCLRACTSHDAFVIGALAAEFHAHLRSVGDDTAFSWGAAEYLRDGFGDDPAFRGVIAELDGRIVAYALYHFGYDTDIGQRYVYLIDLFVSADARRSGIATALMARIADVGRAHNAGLVAWSVKRANRAAVRFYEGLGAKYVHDSHTMWRPIL